MKQKHYFCANCGEFVNPDTHYTKTDFKEVKNGNITFLEPVRFICVENGEISYVSEYLG